MSIRRINLIGATPVMLTSLYHTLMVQLHHDRQPVIGLANAGWQFIGRDHLGPEREMEIFNLQCSLERDVLTHTQETFVLSEFCPLAHRLAALHAAPGMMDPRIRQLDRDHPPLNLVFTEQDSRLHRIMRDYYEQRAERERVTYSTRILSTYRLQDVISYILDACNPLTAAA